MADGGSINLRLSVQGAEAARAELMKMGPAGQAMARELDRALRQPNAALSALDAGAKQARTGLEGLASRGGAAGSVLQAMGGWGMAAAVALAGVGVAAAKALSQAREAMTFSGQLVDAAEQLHVSTDALQEWRHVAIETGADASAADQAIAGFSRRLGEATLGLSKKAMKPFEALGFSAEELRKFDSVETALAEVIKRVANLSDEAQKSALTEKLGLGPLQNAVRRGGDEIERLRDQAHELGVVMDAELIKRADKADEQFDQLSRVIDIQLKSAFVDLAPAIVTAIGLTAQLATALADAMDGWRRLEDKTSRGLSREATRLSAENNDMIRRWGSVANMPIHDPEPALGASGGAAGPGGAMVIRGMQRGSQDAFRENQARLNTIFELLKDRDADSRPADRGTVPPINLGGGGGGNSDQKRKLREAERALEQLTREELSVERARVQEVVGSADTAASREAVARALLDLDERERKEKLAQLAKTLSDGAMLDAEVQARIEKLNLIQAEIRTAKEAEIAETRRRDDAQRALEAQRAQADLTSQILSIASSTARTAEDRRRVELQLLEIAQRQQRAALQAAFDAERDPVEKGRVLAQILRLPDLFAAQTNQVRQQTSGPLDSWWDAQMTGPQAQEWMQGQALGALDDLNKGLIDAFKNIESAGDAFDAMGDVALNALQKVADGLMQIAIQQMLVKPLAGALFGDTSGPGGLLSGLLNSAVGSVFGGTVTATGRKATGGLAGSAGTYLVGERGPELMHLPIGAMIYDADRSQRMIRDSLQGSAHGVRMEAPVVQNNIRVINQTGSPVQARMRSGPDGMIDVFLDKAIDARLAEKGADGSLNRALMLTPRGKRR